MHFIVFRIRCLYFKRLRSVLKRQMHLFLFSFYIIADLCIVL